MFYAMDVLHIFMPGAVGRALQGAYVPRVTAFPRATRSAKLV